MQQVSLLQTVLKDAKNIDNQYHILHENAYHIAKQYDVSVKTPRVCSRQTTRNNHPFESKHLLFHFLITLYLKWKIDSHPTL